MKLKIEIEMDKAVFDGYWEEEASRILEKLAGLVAKGGMALGALPLHDIKGNRVGLAQIVEA